MADLVNVVAALAGVEADHGGDGSCAEDGDGLRQEGIFIGGRFRISMSGVLEISSSTRERT